MKNLFKINVKSLDIFRDFPGGWTVDDYKELLNAIEFDGIEFLEDSEMKDFLLLEFHDLGWEESAKIVLSYKLGDRLGVGQINKIIRDMLEDHIWEEYKDMSCHKDLYNCNVLLKKAFPKKFLTAEMIKLTIEVTSVNRPAIDAMEHVDKSLLTRIIADGMDDHDILNRLFKDQIDGSLFPEADHIIWAFDQSKEEGKELFSIYSSTYWLNALDEVSSFESSVFSDLVKA